MSEFNKFSLYSMNYGATLEKEKDQVDKHIDYLKTEDNYEKVLSYLQTHFGKFENAKWFDFEDINKSCYLLIEDGKIEFCSLKNHKQYYGKGWIKIKND